MAAMLGSRGGLFELAGRAEVLVIADWHSLLVRNSAGLWPILDKRSPERHFRRLVGKS